MSSINKHHEKLGGGAKRLTIFTPRVFVAMSTGDFRVADISLADFGRKEIEIAEYEVGAYQCLALSK